MSPQEDILNEIKIALETNTELIALLTPLAVDTYAVQAEPNTKAPYFVYKFSKLDNQLTGIGAGKLKISIWFYQAAASSAYTAEDIIVRMLDSKLLTGTVIKSCRIWQLGEERKESITKDYFKDKSAINIEVVFYLRWISPPRIASLIL